MFDRIRQFFVGKPEKPVQAGKWRYPVSMPDHSGNDTRYVNEAIRSGWTSSAGPFVERFEKAFAAYVGTKYAVACSSGTAALTIALRAMGVGKGDEVIVPEFTMVASAWAVTYCGAKPVFVDCGDDLNIDVTKIEAAITPKTKVIMAVHVYGRVADMRAIRVLAAKHRLKVIEDAAEAHGAMDKSGKRVGALSGNGIGCFSLFANKIITSGEGGICVTDNQAWAEEMWKLRGMYFNPDHTFLHPKVGYNFRMTNLQAAVACAQLERIGEFLQKREQIRQWYDEEIAKLNATCAPFKKVVAIPRPPGSVLWMYDVLVDNPDEVIARAKAAGIETRVFFKPMSEQPMYRAFSRRGRLERLKAYEMSRRGMYLPTFPQLTNETVKAICRTLFP